MTSRLYRATLVAASTAALALVLGACGSSGGGSDAGKHIAPAAAPSGWAAHEQGRVHLSAPASWNAFEPAKPADAASTGSTAYGLKAPAAADGSGSGVSTIVSTTPKDGAVKAMSMGRTIGETSLGATGIVQEELSWPGAKAAAYLSYEAKLPMPSGADIVFRYEFLTLDLPGGAQAIINVVGPADGFDTAHLHDVLATVKIAS